MNNFSPHCYSAVIVFLFLASAIYFIWVAIRTRYRNVGKIFSSMSSLAEGIVVGCAGFLHPSFAGDLALETVLLAYLMHELIPCTLRLRNTAVLSLYTVIAVVAYVPAMHMAAFFLESVLALVLGLLILYMRVSRPSILVAHVSTPAIVHDSIASGGWMLVIFCTAYSVASRLSDVPVWLVFLTSSTLLGAVTVLLCLNPVIPAMIRKIRSYSVGKRNEPSDSKLLHEGRRQSRELLFHAIEQWLLDEKAFLDPSMCVEEVTEHFFTNRNYVSEAFGEFAKMGFNEYLNRVRVRYARELAEQNPWLTVSELAFRSGYSVPTTFSMAFTRIYDISPRDWLSDLRSQRKKK